MNNTIMFYTMVIIATIVLTITIGEFTGLVDRVIESI